MAHTLDHVPSTGFLSQVFDMLAAIGENSTRGQLANDIANLTEADLEKLGQTREELVIRTFGVGYV